MIRRRPCIVFVQPLGLLSTTAAFTRIIRNGLRSLPSFLAPRQTRGRIALG